MHEVRWSDILAGRDRSPRARALRAMLCVPAAGYGLAVGLRNAMFDLGLRRPVSLGRPVVSVGNLTAGGTGKTPMVIELVRRLETRGARPAVLLRGYRHPAAGASPADQPSDETALLRAALGPAVPVEADPDRVEGGRRALQSHPRVSVYVLDDAFQHRQVHRDVDLVLLDATQPFGGGLLLPAGLLREPVRGLRRASAVIITRADLRAESELQRLEAELARRGWRGPVALAGTTWTGFVDRRDQPVDLEQLADQPVLGVCGLGNPAQFEAMLRRHCPHTADVWALADHQPYSPELLARIQQRAARTAAQAIVTTDKDWAKWRILVAAGAITCPVYRPRMRVTFLRGEEHIDRILDGLLAGGRAPDARG